MWVTFQTLLLLSGALLQAVGLDVVPRAVHLSLYGRSTMRCVWMSSYSITYHPLCQYGDTFTKLNRNVTGRSYSYTAGGFSDVLHEAFLVGLDKEEGSVSVETFYRCGDADAGMFSDVFRFTLQEEKVSGSVEDAPWIGLIADMGVEESSYTVSALAKNAASQSLQLLVHGGDISYADDFHPAKSNSVIWEKYMTDLEPVAAAVPYMTAPGNHEAQFDFAAYQNWLRMPVDVGHKSPSPFYYSFNYLGVHFTMISTEHSFAVGTDQYKWIENDLNMALANRAKVPWLVVVGHRPLYCSSNSVVRRCTEEGPLYRSWLEGLLHQYKVDVYMCGHNHQYERSYPVFNSSVTNFNYTNAQATVYVVNGAAGNKEHNDPEFMPAKLVPWRAAHGHGFETGWMRMRATKTTLQMEYLVSRTGEVQDHFILSKD